MTQCQAAGSSLALIRLHGVNGGEYDLAPDDLETVAHSLDDLSVAEIHYLLPT
jgi:hypothetical protein